MKFLRALLLTAVMCGLGYTAAARWLFPAAADPTDVDFTEVPDLTGTPLAEAERQLAALGFAALERGRLSHDGIAAGAVVAQTPLPGQTTQTGDTVFLTTSAGVETRVVPDLGGLPTADAATLLTRLGFEIDIEDVEDTPAAGAIRTEPEAGARLTLPASVRLFVSRGRAIVTVPDLRGRHVDDLEALLKEVALRLGAVRYQADARDVQGRVVFQSPDPGSPLRGDGLVSVIVAGTPPDTPPDTASDTPPDTVSRMER
ncbi:PASTA domain-containing protein [Candidatus Palauibacter sp.]|uniref:PASTA domain-containing protein n=1 Tax=Candidatus Palauibacter sp. TaxID=3101350 RepID=UPI003B52BDF1